MMATSTEGVRSQAVFSGPDAAQAWGGVSKVQLVDGTLLLTGELRVKPADPPDALVSVVTGTAGDAVMTWVFQRVTASGDVLPPDRRDERAHARQQLSP